MSDPRRSQNRKQGAEDLGWVRTKGDDNLHLSNEKQRSLMPLPSGIDFRFKYQVEEGKICSACGVPGHWRSDCPNRNQLRCGYCLELNLATGTRDHVEDWCFIKNPHLDYKKRGSEV